MDGYELLCAYVFVSFVYRKQKGSAWSRTSDVSGTI